MSHIWMSHVTHINESCHTYEWVMSHIWMSPNVWHDLIICAYICTNKYSWTNMVASVSTHLHVRAEILTGQICLKETHITQKRPISLRRDLFHSKENYSTQKTPTSCLDLFCARFCRAPIAVILPFAGERRPTSLLRRIFWLLSDVVLFWVK